MDIQALVDEFIENNGGEVSNDDLAYHFFIGLDRKKQKSKLSTNDCPHNQLKA